jgi:hexosaminidase
MISCQQQTSVNSINIVPEPVKVEVQKGYFSLNEKSLLLFEGTDSALEQYVRQYFSNYLGVCFSQESDKKYGTVIFRLNTDYDKTVGEEGYRLEVNKEGVMLTANTPAGLVYALQSLYQLAPADVAKNSQKGIQIPQVKIVDYPRFEWRGSHRDVSRHFFDVDHIKRHLDLMALYKMNKFHWHLTDDHGWRLEIDNYPKLTEIGAWRVDRSGISWMKLMEKEYAAKEGEPATYGGYYTKEQVRDIISYAAQRGIEVIPEIEIPGHCSEVLAAYPEFGCDDYPYHVQIAPYWPPKAILCGGNDKVMAFLKDVIDEVVELFPSEYIHIGGDEAFIENENFKHNWELCPKCQKRIKDLKLKNPEALQGWMIREVEQHAKKHGKKIIGWDEIIDGDVTADATVMYWRGWLGDSLLMEIAHKGNPIIMTPTTFCYINYPQLENDPQEGPSLSVNDGGGYIPLPKIYAFDPAPEGLPEDVVKLIKGGQGCLWAEFLYTPKEAEYALLPRLLALSESVWSPVDRKCWKNFETKLPEQKRRLNVLGYNYCDEVGLLKEEKQE